MSDGGVPASDGHSHLRGFVEAQKARLVVAATIFVYFGVMSALGGHSHWTRLGVPAGSPTLMDMRNVTGALECSRRGVAVLPTNPCDPYLRPADFPRIWLTLSHLGLGTGDTFALGVTMAVVFFIAALLVLPGRAGLLTVALYIAVLCSPSVMLGVERGNPDLVIFVLVAGAMLASDGSLFRLELSGALLLFASVLKFYPVLALGAFVRRATRASIVVAGAVTGYFLVYLAVTYSYVDLILKSIPPPTSLAYGVRFPALWFSESAQRALGGFAWLRPWEILLALVGIALGCVCGRSVRRHVEHPARGSDRDLDLFWAAACIFIGSYAVFDSQDYRLIFLLLAVPQLGRWAAQRQVAAIVTVVALLATLWLDVWTQMPGLEHVLNWWLRSTAVGSETLSVAVVAQFALFVSMAAWLFATAPVHVMAPFGRVRRRSVERSTERGLDGVG
jgi:hypothetical protein